MLFTIWVPVCYLDACLLSGALLAIWMRVYYLDIWMPVYYLDTFLLSDACRITVCLFTPSCWLTTWMLAEYY